MAGPLTGISGSVTSWTNNTQYISTGTSPSSFTLNTTVDDLETTAFSDAGTQAHIAGLPSWSGTISTQLKAPANGSLGLVTFSGGYVTNLNAWTLGVNVQALETTAFQSTWKTFIPGTLDWAGTFGGYVDDTTALVVPASIAAAAAVFTYQEKGGTDNNLSGNVFATAMGVNVAPNAVNSVSYSFRGNGALTQSTPSAGAGVFASGSAVALPTAGTLTLTASTGRTYAGQAFWTSIALSVGVNQLTTVAINFTGSGALVAA